MYDSFFYVIRIGVQKWDIGIKIIRLSPVALCAGYSEILPTEVKMRLFARRRLVLDITRRIVANFGFTIDALIVCFP